MPPNNGTGPVSCSFTVCLKDLGDVPVKRGIRKKPRYSATKKQVGSFFWKSRDETFAWSVRKVRAGIVKMQLWGFRSYHRCLQNCLLLNICPVVKKGCVSSRKRGNSFREIPTMSSHKPHKLFSCCKGGIIKAILRGRMWNQTWTDSQGCAWYNMHVISRGILFPSDEAPREHVLLIQN